MKYILTITLAMFMSLPLMGQYKNGGEQENQNNQIIPSFVVYPNPTNGVFYVTTNSKSSSVMLLNSRMEVIASRNSEVEVKFDITNLSRGVYTIVVMIRSEKVVKKVLF